MGKLHFALLTARGSSRLSTGFHQPHLSNEAECCCFSYFNVYSCNIIHRCIGIQECHCFYLCVLRKYITPKPNGIC